MHKKGFALVCPLVFPHKVAKVQTFSETTKSFSVFLWLIPHKNSYIKKMSCSR